MKTTYTDKELQAAIDNAILLFGRENGMSWEQLADNRLAIAKTFLEKLESDPYAALKKAHAEGKVIQRNIHSGIGSAAACWQDKSNADWSWPVDTYRIKPEASTFEAHGKTWTRHTPGDAMPCDGKSELDLIYTGGFTNEMWTAKFVDWSYEGLKGWRYTDEQPTPAMPEWTPAVGDVVQLKSGGPKMTIAALSEQTSLVPCQWFDEKNPRSHAFPKACLTPVTE